jgi:hypothetical protein
MFKIQVCSTAINWRFSLQCSVPSIILCRCSIIMICEKYSRAMQYAIKQFPTLRRDSVGLSQPQNVRAYQEDRFDLLESAANACWICAKLGAWLASETSSPLPNGTADSLHMEYRCAALMTTNCDVALAIGDAKRADVGGRFMRDQSQLHSLIRY